LAGLELSHTGEAMVKELSNCFTFKTMLKINLLTIFLKFLLDKDLKKNYIYIFTTWLSQD